MSDTMQGETAGRAEGAGYGVRPPGFRLPDATRLGPVVLQVAELERSLGFYEQVLGLRPVRQADGSADLAAADDRVLVRLQERPGAAPMPRRGRLGLYHFAILLPDRAALGRFVLHLRRLGVPAGMSDHLVSEAVYLSDPDGLGIEVYADRPRAAWRTRGNELEMTTEPLDVAAVAAAAGDERWAGMPRGTVMGHVHLFVADLERASEFYHRGLGLDRVVWSYPGALFMSAGGYHHHLGTNTWAAGAAPAGDDDARLVEWTVVLPDADAVAAAAGSLEAVGRVVERDAAGWTAADPWGTRVRVSAGA